MRTLMAISNATDKKRANGAKFSLHQDTKAKEKKYTIASFAFYYLHSIFVHICVLDICWKIVYVVLLEEYCNAGSKYYDTTQIPHQ